MKQKYKVFLRDTEFVFSESEIKDASDEFKAQRSDIMDILEKGLPASKVNIQSTDPEKAFREFQSLFETIDAAGGIVVDPRTGKFLLIERLGVWDFPKGKMDEGEIPESTATREVEEECGVDGLVTKNKIATTYHGYMYKGSPTLKKTHWYFMECLGNTHTKGQADEGITDVRWVERNEVHELIKSGYASIRELWQSFNSSYPDIP
jgi:8-oxo-dGTP pyrophosphatase MutT (NUDIX family)